MTFHAVHLPGSVSDPDQWNDGGSYPGRATGSAGWGPGCAGGIHRAAGVPGDGAIVA